MAVEQTITWFSPNDTYPPLGTCLVVVAYVTIDEVGEPEVTKQVMQVTHSTSGWNLPRHIQDAIDRQQACILYFAIINPNDL